jgi:hypothetical protein
MTSTIGVLSLTAALLGPAGQVLGSCVCGKVDPSEIVKHAGSIARVRITTATIARTDCPIPDQPSCGIDAVATLEYFKGSGPTNFAGRVTNTDPYVCGVSVKTGDELLEVGGSAPSLGSMTHICVLYATINNRKLIEQFRDIARQSQSGNP